MPYPLRFLITSRPEPHVTRGFGYDVVRYNLSDDSNADNDIRNFLDGEFEWIRHYHPQEEHLPRWPPRGAISSIVERSSGHFIYPSTVMCYIRSPDDQPNDRLLVILGTKQPDTEDLPYGQLDALYTLIFCDIKNLSQREKIHRALGIIHLRSLKPSGLFARPWTSNRHTIDVLLNLRPGDLALIFNQLLSLVTFDDGDLRISKDFI